MYVKNHILTKDKLTVVYLDEDMRSALKKIDEGDFLSLPVFDRNNFKGILMKEAIYRYYYDSDFCGNKSKFLDDVKVKDIYSINFKSIRENEPIEDASYLLNELRTPFLPVFDARNNFVGILTHKAIFDAFSEMFGLGEGTRITVNLLDVPGQLAKLTEIIRKENVNILNIAVMDAKIMDVYKVVIRINTKDVENIIEKIEKSGVKICDLKGVSVFRGVTTGYNPAFIIDTEKRNQFIDTDPNNEKIIKPLLQGRNIRKWIYYYNNDYLIFTKQGIDIDSFPIIKSYLKKYYSELKPREGDEKGGRKPGSYNWFEIQDNTAYYPEFEKSEKIIWGLTADKWAFAYDDKQHYLPSNGYILTSNVVSIKYLLALLNSNLLKYYFGFIGVMTAGGAYTLKHATIQQLPIVLSENQKPIIDLVDKILFAKVNNNNTAILEKKLDEHIYSLYNLTDKEIEIIENS